MTEQVILVDYDDNEIGYEEKLNAHKLGLLHRAFSVFLFKKTDGIIYLLLQQREKSKYHCGGLWTNTCCSHPRKGEEVLDAGERRLNDELGFTVDLHYLGNFTYKAQFDNGLVEHEYDHVLVGCYQGEEIKPNPEEVESCRWVTLDELDEWYQKNPVKFTPWFKKAYKIVEDNMDFVENILGRTTFIQENK